MLKEKRSKLEPTSKKGIFVGYSEISKAYRTHIPRQKLIQVLNLAEMSILWKTLLLKDLRALMR